MEATAHRPVLLREALAALAVRPGGFWVDGTVGAGGHAEAILRATSPDGRLLACDRDAESLRAARARLAPFGERAVLRHSDYRRLPDLLDEVGSPAVAGILLDLGISSLQLDDPERGFSFQKDGPLDMRIDRTQPATAADLVNSLAEGRLAAILKEYGEEKAAGRIARVVARERAKAPITSTRRLAEIVAEAAPARGPSRIHPATRTFQALRLAVNDELAELDGGLASALEVLAPGGRLAVLSYHSGEDRRVKEFLLRESRGCICPPQLPVCGCGRKPRMRLLGRGRGPSAAEARRNPRARSARLRGGVRC